MDRAKQVSEPDEERSPSAQWPIANADIGSYELLRPIGHGGMGSVYLARHRQLGKQLALKLLSTRLHRGGGYTARFQREMRAAGGLDHPAIVRATDAGEHNGTHYLAMEYIEGLDLSRIVRLVGKLDIADACEIARQVALGLSHAHASGVTHRDIKPSNIMLSTKGEVKILDFGLARLSLWDEASAELTTVGQLIGTLDYMAPEQAERPDSVDYRADLYALGATLFRLLCGRAPLAASPEMSPLAKLRLLATHQPPSLATLRPDAPESLVQLVASLLARDPESRPASAAHVAEALTQFSQGADLPGLVTRAQARAEKEADEELAVQSNHLSRLTQPTDALENEIAAGAAKPPRRLRHLLAWAFAPLAILAGVLITLETQKGNLVIESDAANVTVKLLRNGKPYEQLKIEPGVTSTRVYAGQYEVAIDGGSDSLVVEGSHIEIRRGETAIAHIRQLPTEVVAAQAAQAVDSLDHSNEIVGLKQQLAELHRGIPESDDEPLYEGKPLSYWLDMVGREKSNEGYQEALNALYSMADEEYGERISAVLLSELPTQPESRGFAIFDRQALVIVKTTHPGADFYRLMAKELESGDSVWHRRILAALTYIEDDQLTIAPLTDWLEAKVFASSQSQLLTPAADYYQALVQRDTSSLTAANKNAMARAKEHYAQVLLNCEALGDTYWLAKPSYVPTPDSSPYSPWYPPLGNRIEERAIHAVTNLEADRTLVGQALVILTVLNSTRYDRTGLDDRRVELIAALRTALKNLQSEPEKLYESQLLPEAFLPESNRYQPQQIHILSPNLPEPTATVHIARSASLPLFRPSLAVLELIDETSARAELAEELLELFETTGDLNAELYAALKPVSGIIQVSWPDVQFVDRAVLSQADRAKTSPKHVLAAMLHYQAYELLPEEKQAELRAAAAEKYGVAQLDGATPNTGGMPRAKAARQTPAGMESAASQTKEPLYKGRPLSEWLDTIDRETSYEGYEESLTAMKAMVKPDNAQEITQVLLKVLRSRAERPQTREEDRCNAIAFTVLRMAHPDKAFYELLVKELESGSNAWHVRLLDSLTLVAPDDAERMAPLTQWLEKNVFSKSQGEGAKLLAASKDYFLYLAHRTGNLSPAARGHFADVLVHCEALDDAQWLSMPIYENVRPWSRQPFVSSSSTQPYKRWQPTIGDRIVQAAVRVLGSDRPDRKLAAQALIILRTLYSSKYDRVGMQDHRAGVVDALRGVMKRWQAEPTELFASAELSYGFDRNWLEPRKAEVLSPWFEEARSRSFVLHASSPIVNVSMEALALVAEIHAGSDLNEELVWVFNATSDRNAKVYQAPDFNNPNVRWPELETRPPQTEPGDQAGIAPAAAEQTDGLTRDDWLAAMLHTKAFQLLPIETQTQLKTTAYRQHATSLVAEQIHERDSDGDGVLSFEEAKPLGYDLRKADSNGDQRLSAEELVEYRTQLFMAPSIANPNDPKFSWAKKMIERYDRNRDGVLTEDEWSVMVLKPDGADLDHDGRITVEEYAKFRK
ncbi:MAG: protein kinase domain-containing protein [Aureliella sp.]